MQLHEAIAITYSLMGQDLTDAALKVACQDLKAYPLPAVLTALERCRKECRHIALVDVISRINETKALGVTCTRCNGPTSTGRTLTCNKWVCQVCREDYMAGKWGQPVAATA